MFELPESFRTQAEQLLGADAEAFFASYDNEPVRGLRVNLLKNSTVAECSKTSVSHSPHPDGGRPLSAPSTGFSDMLPVPWCDTGFIYDPAERPGKTLAYHAGLFYIQEPSAMCPAEVLGVSPGQRVLDLCAAPGGKSVQIAGHLAGEGLLVSNDASASRSRALVKNSERAGITNAVVLTEQPKKLAARFPEFFDRILVDAPCSGEGMFRRDPDVIKAYTANKPEACAAVQAEILRHAATMLAPGGRLVYSTCTFNRLENEDIIAAFLAARRDFSHVEIDCAALGIQKGFDGKSARIWPHSASGEGHFVALLEKTLGETFLKKSFPQTPFKKLHPETARGAISGGRGQIPREFKLFSEEILNGFAPAGHFVTHGANLFLQPFAIDFSGLRVARSGWFLGEIAKNRFVPSQAFAMGLRKEQVRFSAELSQSDAEKYLRGESLFFEMSEEGKPWVLICRDGHPLGWARLVQGRLKNQLPAGWVMKG
ncbi:MAG: RsmB/NOP family class I SAM-dependent RNA methyltransferase [Defluviitaleaceae bacterium]|nr:RsmB/NOP family class I SAM-dependent RNA methyltransferase [Defluviitaleaceae bacterium]